MSQQSSFRLNELLVVVTGVGLLLSLAIPAVHTSHPPARRVMCRNRLKQLVVATIQHEGARNRFPGFQEDYGVRSVSWCVRLFPYIEQDHLHELWTDGKVKRRDRLAPFISAFVCPSAEVDEQRPSNNYIVNAGFFPRVGDPGKFGVDADANGVSDYWNHPNRQINNGVFHDLVNCPTAKINASDFKDGMTQTLLFSESLQAMDWDTAPGISKNGALGSRTGTTFQWLYSVDKQELLKCKLVIDNLMPTLPLPHSAHINVGKSLKFWAPSLARPSSNHPGGVNVAFADGHCRFINENIPYHILQSLMTPNGRESDQPLRAYQLTPTDWH